MLYEPTNDQEYADYCTTLGALKVMYDNGFILCTKDYRGPLDNAAWLRHAKWGRVPFNVTNCKSFKPFLEAKFVKRSEANYSASGLYWGTSTWYEYQFKF